MKELDMFSTTRMRNGFIVTDDMIIANTTEGSESKFFIAVNGTRYLVKDSSWNLRRKRESLAPFCEYVGSHFIRESGLLKCQECFLGVYNGRPVVICKDVFDGEEFRPFQELHESSAGTDLSTKEYTYDDVTYVIKKKFSVEKRSEVIHDFWLMFLFDAVLGNKDRHSGNWGFVKCESGDTFSPIFDNGASLFPDVDLDAERDKEFIRARVFDFPASQFKMWREENTERPMKTNFWQIIKEHHAVFKEELECMQSLAFESLLETALLDVPSKYAEWFRTIITARYRVMIMMENFDVVWEDLRND